MSAKKQVKSWYGYFFLILIVVFLGVKIYSWRWPTVDIKMNDHNLKVLVAHDYWHLQRGLGGRDDLGDYDGMLFLFPEKEQHVFVMRAMKFAIDIVWLDRGIVVDVAQNILPEPDKAESELTRYPARLPSTAVLEFPAGAVERLGIKIGDKLEVGQ